MGNHIATHDRNRTLQFFGHVYRLAQERLAHMPHQETLMYTWKLNANTSWAIT